MEDNRLEPIFAQIIRLANADFQTPGVISENGDEIDSITVGLNLLGEELEFYTLQLKESEERIKYAYTLLTEAQHLSHIGSWEWDIASNAINWSDELYRIYGRDKETFESSYDNYLLCTHPEDREYVNETIQAAYLAQKPFSFSHRILCPYGTERYLDCKGDVYVGDDGELKRMTGTAQDVTDLRKTEEKLRQLASIVESSGDAIISKTIEGYITSWNKQAEILFGYTEKEILGQHVSLLFPPARLDEEEEIVQNMLAGNALVNYETERMRKDGSIVNIAATISPIKNPAGKVIGISKIARDISDKKIAEEKIRLYTLALEQKNKETEQFAYVASHDLQEPLRTITNYIGLFHERYKGQLDESADMYLDFISSASTRMKTLISNLLDYTRIESNNQHIEIDSAELLRDVLKDMEVTIAENNASILLGDLPVIRGNPSGMRSLFQNLISNAVKFRNPAIHPVITITAKDMEKEWQFEVKDNGIGMEQIYFEKIFKLFQRLHARTEYQGTGIGLAHCKKIIDLRGGKIWVESELEKGSSFYFTIPKTYNL